MGSCCKMKSGNEFSWTNARFVVAELRILPFLSACYLSGTFRTRPFLYFEQHFSYKCIDRNFSLRALLSSGSDDDDALICSLNLSR